MADKLARQCRLHGVTDPQAIGPLQGGPIQAALPPLAHLPRVRIGFYRSTAMVRAPERAALQEAMRQAVPSEA